jgi:hypothetical protein
MNSATRLELFQEIGKASQRHKRNQPTSSRPPDKRQCIQTSDQNIEPLRSLFEFLPLPKRSGKMTKEKLMLVRDALKEAYVKAALPPTTWPTSQHSRVEIQDSLLIIADLLRRSSHGLQNADDSDP